MKYDCTICRRQYRYEESLYLHMKTDHGGMDVDFRAGNSADHRGIDIDVREGNSSVDQLIIADAVRDVIDNGASSERDEIGI